MALDQIVLVGQRDRDPFEQELIDLHNNPHVNPQGDLAAELRASIAGWPIYVHEGGLSLDDMRIFCNVIADHLCLKRFWINLRHSQLPESSSSTQRA